MKKTIVIICSTILTTLLASCGLDETPTVALTQIPEDRNLTILGGGKISWNLSADEVSFTANIVVRDHRTDKVTTITTAASPIKLTHENDVAYFERTMAPETNQTVEELTTVAGGLVPERTNHAGPVVLFHRTDEGTLWIPWVQREMLSGDFWQWGTQLSWYERMTASRKPSYYNNGSDDSIVTVPGSSSSPTVVNIDGKLYANTSNVTMDLDNSEPRGGLDTGTKEMRTPYYLYAIPATTDRTFEIVASTTDPSTGPNGFTSWSYIGACATNDNEVEFTAFQAFKGMYLGNEEIEVQEVEHGGSLEKLTFSAMPLTVTAAWVQLHADPQPASGEGELVSVSGTNSGQDAIQIYLPTAGINAFQHGWVPISTSQSMWGVPNTNTACSVQLQGWQEDPMAYK